MGKAKIDGRGRVTLPQEFRRDMCLSPGDDVEVEEIEEGLLIRRPHTARELFDGLKGCITKDSAVEPLDPMSLKRLIRAGD
jgi:AbrB family looped-hinge helix DNA binding protein